MEWNGVLSHIDDLVVQRRLGEAAELLGKVYSETNSEGYKAALPQILFRAGNIAYLHGSPRHALDLYISSIDAGNISFMVYLNVSSILGQLGEIRKMQEVLETAAEMGFAKQEEQIIWLKLHGFYLKHAMYLKAGRVAQDAVDKYPDEYYGYHLQVAGLICRGEFDLARQRLDGLEAAFGYDPAYLNDKLDILEKQGLYEEMLREIGEDSRYREVIPKLTLQKQFHLYVALKRNKELQDTARELFASYGDEGSCFIQMMIALESEDYQTAAKVASYILKTRQRGPGLVFYMTMYMEQLILYKLEDGKLTEWQKEQMQRALNISTGWLGHHGVFPSNMPADLEELGFTKG